MNDCKKGTISHVPPKFSQFFFDTMKMPKPVNLGELNGKNHTKSSKLLWFISNGFTNIYMPSINYSIPLFVHANTQFFFCFFFVRIFPPFPLFKQSLKLSLLVYLRKLLANWTEIEVVLPRSSIILLFSNLHLCKL